MNLDRAILRNGVETPYIGECGRFDSCHGHNALLQKMPKNRKIMAITKYNSAQFSEVSNNQLAGVTMVYRSVRKNGDIVETAIHFGGKGYVPETGADAKETEVNLFRVWKEVLTVFWNARYDCAVLQKDNSGITSKLRATTPTEIVVRYTDGSVAFKWIAADSTYARVGIVPGSKELKMKRNDYKKHIHKASVASFNALKNKTTFKCAEAPETPENTEAPKEA